ncbi:hypothetical protein [Bacillus wiedmannii]|uniref:hypothetical protein n=1 Tax=Bacillus wiedmannii TaxID=1890302 RepID=UPI0007DB44F6|nr:hypothetical protein [Bacillus wiedmannii]OAK13800.1 hypothetical protein A6281_12885 [Bacillus wiedmannii]OAK22310.1 hypothetical protein A6282_26825 [Bacillus wiedmannii]
MITQKRKKAERYTEVTKLLQEFIEKVQAKDYSLKPAFSNDLSTLFSTTAWGFREITLVVIVARLFDQNFKASEALYDCNPRPLFEGPIRDVFIKYNIPTRKSGPLNVAKAAKGINEEWAEQRRPKEAAKSVVNLVQWIEASSKEEVENLGVCLMGKFLSEAERVESLNIEVDPKSDPTFISMACGRLINETPDAGNTPQRIFGLLLHNYHEDLDTGIIVTGYEDRASTTSLTSKKPGDVNEETSSGEILRIYEVTVKRFDMQRIKESYDTVKAYKEENDTPINEILVVCRKSDIPVEMEPTNLNGVLGKYTHQDVDYYFIDIFEWLMLQLLRMTSNARISFYEALDEYISNPNTAENVKELWIEINK